jgi:hypothetical protein
MLTPNLQILGNLWILGIWTGDKKRFPSMHPPGSREEGRM